VGEIKSGIVYQSIEKEIFLGEYLDQIKKKENKEFSLEERIDRATFNSLKHLEQLDAKFFNEKKDYNRAFFWDGSTEEAAKIEDEYLRCTWDCFNKFVGITIHNYIDNSELLVTQPCFILYFDADPYLVDKHNFYLRAMTFEDFYKKYGRFLNIN
jgi:hypothetical protein